MPARMSGALLTGHGGPEKLAWSDAIPVPRPGPGEALVQVLAAGVNNTDINTRIGWYAREVTGATAEGGGAAEAGGWAGALAFPRIQGGDLCGRVVALGQGAGGPPPGARVICPINMPEPTPERPFAFRALGSELDGAFAEYCAVPARQLHDVSAAPLSDVELAAIPCNFGTAAGLLRRAGVRTGHRVLVTGASGGVGLAAVQLARLAGARVTGVASGAKQAAVREAGAEDVLGRDDTPPAQGFDAVIDVVGGAGWGALIEALRPGGHYAVSGAIAGPVVEADLRVIYLNDITIHGATYQPEEVFAGLVAAVVAGRIRPRIAETYPLRRIAEAQAAFQAKRTAGKIVLIPGDDRR
ncbi:zinc-binding dehydrogenase [Paralimibaculum aggregatum]|uniref:zinc-binding dehydrogenase n=1 Tax=Paralimibaculum aggregatum TaxID=3036245 RepID=UPI003DA0875A